MNSVQAVETLKRVVQFREDKIKIRDLSIFECLISDKEVIAIDIVLKENAELKDKVDKVKDKLERDIEEARNEYQIRLSDFQDGKRAEAQDVLNFMKEME